MTLELQFKIKSNPNYIKFLRENSFWYKTLNRNPELFNLFVDEMKEKYKLRASDKINNVVDKINLIQSFLSVMR